MVEKICKKCNLRQPPTDRGYRASIYCQCKKIGRPKKDPGTHTEYQRIGIHLPIYKKIKSEAKKKNITINQELGRKYKIKVYMP